MNAIQELARKIGWFHVILTTGCFSGYNTLEPGTAGTIVAIPIYLLFVRTNWVVYLIVTCILFALGVRGARKVEEATGQEDHKIIVIDEIVGYLVTMCFVPQHWLYLIVGFLLFRMFDCLKPYPIRHFDKNPQYGSYGVMFDDVLAGIYANIILQLLARLLP